MRASGGEDYPSTVFTFPFTTGRRDHRMIVTDLNDRERKRFAEVFERMSAASASLAAALRSGDDQEALIYLVSVALCGGQINDLSEIMRSAMTVTVPDHPPVT